MLAGGASLFWSNWDEKVVSVSAADADSAIATAADSTVATTAHVELKRSFD